MKHPALWRLSKPLAVSIAILLLAGCASSEFKQIDPDPASSVAVYEYLFDGGFLIPSKRKKAFQSAGEQCEEWGYPGAGGEIKETREVIDPSYIGGRVLYKVRLEIPCGNGPLTMTGGYADEQGATVIPVYGPWILP